ncbi:sugar ABC transporter ATP-binding protein [Thermoflexus sp.]|uniref:sugar ABC transporter ATP-binding protein n=1 Tax=Thermoflexus sp. TaxID=1969742 RepID=UPI002ADD986C|nr:sugar ABC transporter ATP-binding protein [Thermoflexus sp.]
MASPILSLRNLYKAFPGVQALAGVSLDLYPGEVHALVGENGAGKSTLIKIAAGVHVPDAGEILFEGRPVRLEGPRHAAALGIAVIHQEPYLFPTLSVLENLFAGFQPRRGPLGLVDWRTMARRAERVFEELGISLPLDLPAGDLSAAQQQLLQIARALLQDAKVLIMDEPTSSLSQREVQTLFEIVRRLRSRGVGILYISHRLEEVFVLADRVTVLRDGQWVGTYPIAAVTPETLIARMVGRELTQLFPHTPHPPGDVLLRVHHLSRRGLFEGISFEIRAGEIVGMAGLIGAGRSEVAQAIFGILPADAGFIEVNGRRMIPRAPWEAMDAGIFYIPEDRHRQGIVAPLSVRSNLTLAILRRLTRFGLVDERAERGLAQAYRERLRIRIADLEQPVGTLSGGNQQKVVVARGLAIQPRVLILDEPTRGIDVGTKAEIHRLMDELAAQGMGILMISSELPEILGMSDRILVMRAGRLMGELWRDEATQERVMAMAMGLVSGNRHDEIGIRRELA